MFFQTHRRGITYTQLAPQRQGRQPALRLADQIDRQKPCGQRQFCALKDGPGDQRGLVGTARALGYVARAVRHSVTFCYEAMRRHGKRSDRPLFVLLQGDHATGRKAQQMSLADVYCESG